MSATRHDHRNPSSSSQWLPHLAAWFSRRVLSWRISNTMEVGFCIETVQEALENFGEPEFFNSDQGSQYTSSKFQELFVGRTTQVSMDGAGRWVDNVLIERFWWTLKYEDFHLKRYDTVQELQYGVMSFMEFYNHQRPHSSLANLTPDWVYVNGVIRRTDGNISFKREIVTLSAPWNFPAKIPESAAFCFGDSSGIARPTDIQISKNHH